MNSKMSEFESLPQWMKRIFPIISIIVAILLFSFVWFRYNESPLQLENWVRLILLAIMGVVFLCCSLLYIFNKEVSWKWFMGGFALFPLQLILLLIYVLKAIGGFIFGEGIPEPIQKFMENYPSKFDIIILIVLFIVIISQIIKIIKGRF